MKINTSAYSTKANYEAAAYPSTMTTTADAYPVSHKNNGMPGEVVKNNAGLKIAGGFAGSLVLLIIAGKTMSLGSFSIPTDGLKFGSLKDRFKHRSTETTAYQPSEFPTTSESSTEFAPDTTSYSASTTESTSGTESTTATTSEQSVSSSASVTPPPTPTASPAPAPTPAATTAAPAVEATPAPVVVLPSSLDGYLRIIGNPQYDFDTRFNYSEICLNQYFATGAVTIEVDKSGTELTRMPVSDMLGIMRMNEVSVKVKDKQKTGNKINTITVVFLY